MQNLRVIGQANVLVSGSYRRRSINIVADVHDNDVVVAVGLNPLAIEFLLQNLPHDDGFTKDLILLRDEMKDLVWETHL